MPDIAKATPAKEFFISMITRDIALDECLLDLLDNSIDGARRERAGAGEPSYSDFRVQLALSGERFLISDNCGGIDLADARDYAFHFGRHANDDREPDESIGFYGIGMKRALFKIGRVIVVRSSTEAEAFEVDIDVEQWKAETGDWAFPLEVRDAGEPGTTIEITELNRGIAADFEDEAFVNRLRSIVSRDYAVFLQKGLSVLVNDEDVSPLAFELRVSDEFEPARISYEDEGVHVELTAGMAAPPPEDDSAQAEIRGTDRFGWYVICNDRVVLAGDKTASTVWGHERFRTWHGQYNGFMGIASFRSDDPALLPWTTTKRDVDDANGVYRRAVATMKDLTVPFIEYTTKRKGKLPAARKLEQNTSRTPIEAVKLRKKMKVPQLGSEPSVTIVNIQYQRPHDEVRKAAAALGNKKLHAKTVGMRTFDYFYDREVEE